MCTCPNFVLPHLGHLSFSFGVDGWSFLERRTASFRARRHTSDTDIPRDLQAAVYEALSEEDTAKLIRTRDFMDLLLRESLYWFGFVNTKFLYLSQKFFIPLSYITHHRFPYSPTLSLVAIQPLTITLLLSCHKFYISC